MQVLCNPLNRGVQIGSGRAAGSTSFLYRGGIGLACASEEAREGLKAQGTESEFSEFEDRAFQDDMGIDILYDMALDGIEDTPVGDSMRYANLQFDQWFEPFLNASTPIHPYAAEEVD